MKDISEIEEHVDRLKLKKPFMKKKTAVVVSFAVVLMVAMASAGLISHFGEIKTVAHVAQAVTIDGHNWDDPIINFEGTVKPGCCYTSTHTIEVDACEGMWLDWETPPIEGVDVTIYEFEDGGNCCNHILWELELEVLDGMATWDDFDVQVDGIDVYSYEAQGGDPETWIMHNIDLTPFEIPCCGAHMIKIICTACEPWRYFDPYGQLAVNYAALYCEPDVSSQCCPGEPVLCDEVDIGNPASESGHYMDGWGPIEPANSGGVYGGINDCRATWFWTDGDDLPQTTDAPHALLELSCEECYEESECDCEHPIMETPFYLDVGESMDICYAVHFSTMIAPGEYEISTILVPVDPPQPL